MEAELKEESAVMQRVAPRGSYFLRDGTATARTLKCTSLPPVISNTSHYDAAANSTPLAWLFAARFATAATPTRRPDRYWKDVNNHKLFLEEMATELGLKEVSDNFCPMKTRKQKFLPFSLPSH